MVPLAKILERLGLAALTAGREDAKISGLSYDSRAVSPGHAFFCIKGEKWDGNTFIEEAIERGASVIFSEQANSQLLNANAAAALIKVDDIHLALAKAADCYYDSPSRRLRLLGVTGTNGKTTTTHLVEQILTSAGKKVGLIGTLGARVSEIAKGQYLDAKHTTPQASDLQALLFNMVDLGVTHVVMEVSSHALALKRVAECQFASASFTNLTQDHLDFHKTMEHYFLSKRMLFEQLNASEQKNRYAVINIDDPHSERFLSAVEAGVKKLTYSLNKKADAFVEDFKFDFSGTDVSIATTWGHLTLHLKLHGNFNIYNVLAALLIVLSEGVSLAQCKEALESFTGVPGRFETVASSQNQTGPLCLVDYAHSPDGLENVLKAARALVPEGGKLIAVFGCGGNRDSSKRPQMGQIAEFLADQIYVTSDNPRSEDPLSIIADILAGIKRMKGAKVEPDRQAAISAAIKQAGNEDVIVIAGKGHETYQILSDRTIDFDDRLIARKALQDRAGII